MGHATDFYPAFWQQDGTNIILGRITAADGTGAATGVAGEGNWIKQIDIAADGIACTVFDIDANPVSSTTVSITSAAIIDTPVTSSPIWTGGSVGYNFALTLPASAFPANHTYVVEVKITTTGGGVCYGKWKGVASQTRS